MIEPTEMQQQALKGNGEQLRVFDPATSTEYVLVRADVYSCLQHLLEQAEDETEQEAWADRTGFPVDEIILQLADMVPGWFPRLQEHHLLDESQEQELLALRDYLGSVPFETLIVH